jgi:C-methyltransferase C-terminal domain/Putative zinc binding domain/Methyltransferase domain
MANSCDLCHTLGLTTLLDMGDQPIAERMGSTEMYPLKLMMCPSCGLAQLPETPSQEELFPPDHPYASGNTQALRDHFAAVASELQGRLNPGDVVVDIGANDGTFLSCLPDFAERVAVEPTNQIGKCPDGIVQVQEFFRTGVAKGIRGTFGPAKIVTAFNVLAHVPDPHDFVAGARLLLGPDGYFITENHDFASILNGTQIDTIYHEHARYYTPATLSRLLEENGLYVERLTRVGTHGGSFRVAAQRSCQPGDLRSAAALAASDLNGLLATIKASGWRVYGVGAATRATPLIHFAKIAEYLSCVCETPSSEKIGLTMPGTQLKVVDESRLVEDQPEYALLFAWHVKDSIIPKLRVMGYRGKFIIPLPHLEIESA